MVTLEDARLYLRVDSYYDDENILNLLASAEALCSNIARLSAEEWNAICDYSADSTGGLTIRSEDKSHAEILQIKDLLRVAVLFTLGYLYEHREEANHHDLSLTLRNLLASVREGVL